MSRSKRWIAVVAASIVWGCTPADPYAGLTGGGYGPRPGGDDDDATDDGAGQSDAGDDSGAAPSCAEIGPEGICVGNELHYCSAPTGSADPTLQVHHCQPYEACQLVDGVAKCVLQADCIPGQSRCSGAVLEVCGDSGSWGTLMECPAGCEVNGLGAACKAAGDTVQYKGQLLYETRLPKDDLSGWEAPISVHANGFYVVSWHADSVVGVAITDGEGRFEVPVKNPIADDDKILIYAARFDQTTSKPLFAVINPDLGGGEQPTTFDPGPGWSYHAWSYSPKSVESGKSVVITAANGSGAARVFDYLRYVYGSSAAYFKGPAPSLVVWLEFGTTWTCGACFAAREATWMGQSFATQMYISGSEHGNYFADTVTAHELGHFVMHGHSSSPNEGGKHCVGIPAMPGIAYSEGWATGYSSIMRDNPLDVFVSGSGTFWWVDLGRRERDSGGAWMRGDPDDGLLQEMDELEVSAMVWDLYANNSVTKETLFGAFESPRLQGPQFGRDYNRHVWTVDEDCEPTDVQETDLNVPMFADFLDALRCFGVSRSAIDAVTDPDDHYPYPSDDPICD